MRTLGLDLGGTNIKVAVLEDGRVVGTATTPTGAADGPPAVIGRLVAAGLAARERWGPFDAAGVGVPGLYDADRGEVVMLPNLPGQWAGQPIVAELAGAFGVPVAIINDARAFTLAEARLGAAAGCDTVVCLVFGTGIGGGLVVDGRPLLGRHGRAGEIAHQTVVADGPRCGCGNLGCLEAVATSGALARLAGKPDVESVFVSASNGDEGAAAAIETVADHIGTVVANMITLLVPDRIVLGGGVLGAGHALLGPIRAAVARHSVLVPADWYDVVPAVLGADAGAIGAAVWAADDAGTRHP